MLFYFSVCDNCFSANMAAAGDLLRDILYRYFAFVQRAYFICAGESIGAAGSIGQCNAVAQRIMAGGCGSRAGTCRNFVCLHRHHLYILFNDPFDGHCHYRISVHQTKTFYRTAAAGKNNREHKTGLQVCLAKQGSAGRAEP